MRRALRFIALGLSIASLVAVVWLWTSTRHRALEWEEKRVFTTDDDLSREAYHERGVYSYGGRIIFSETSCNAIDLSNGERVFWALEKIAAGPAFGRVIERESYLSSWYWHRRVWFPHWLIAVLSLPYPLFRLASAVRRRRSKRGGASCEGCGYDLRASIGRCPECGRVIARKSGAVESS